MDSMFRDALELFLAGGGIMYMLGGVAFILYATAFAAFAYVNRGNLNEKDAARWEEWITDPEKAEGNFGDRTAPIVAFGASFPTSASGVKVEYKVDHLLWETEYGPAD